jgi:transposase
MAAWDNGSRACCGGVTLAAIPVGLEDGSPFSVNIVALAHYLRLTHAISYRRLTQLFLNLYALHISEGALDAMLQHAKPCFDTEVAAILARLRRSRIVGSDETSVRIDGPHPLELGVPERSGGDPCRAQQPRRQCPSGRGPKGMGHRSDGRTPAQHLGLRSLWRAAGPCRPSGQARGHASGRSAWRTNCAIAKYAIEAGDTIFAPRMKAQLLRAVVLARRRKILAESTRRSYQRRLDRELNAIMVLASTHRDGRLLRIRYGKIRNSRFTFLEYPDVPPDNNGSERELRPTATYRKVTGGFRSQWGAKLFAGFRSVVGTAARRGTNAYQAIHAVLGGKSVLLPG